MSDSDEKGPIAPVEPLKSLLSNGEPLRRPATVETEIGRVRTLPQSERVASLPGMYSETIINLVLNGGKAEPEFWTKAVQQIYSRAKRCSLSTARRFKRFVKTEIAENVAGWVVQLVCDPNPDPCLDFFQVSFARAVHTRTLNEIRTHMRSAMGGRRGWYKTDELDEEGAPMERTIEFAPDTRPSPEDSAIRNVVIQQSASILGDTKQFEAMELHYGQGVPIRSANPNKMDLVRYFGLPENQIRYLLESGKRVVRDFLIGGVE